MVRSTYHGTTWYVPYHGTHHGAMVLLNVVEDFNRRVNLSVMPANARIERHSANALPKSKKKKRNRDQSYD